MSTSLVLLTFFVPLWSQDAIPSTEQNCFAYFADFHSTFDVCDLQAFRGTALTHYQVDDNKNSNTSDNYDYWFNIGGALAIEASIFPPVCLNTAKRHSYCNQTNIDNITGHGQCKEGSLRTITDFAWAYQVKYGSNADGSMSANQSDCFYLSNSNGGPPQWRLINDFNPVQGVKLTYLDGEFDSVCGKNRQFSIQFECENTGARFIPSAQSNIDEYSPCAYTWRVQSLYGCPTECPQTNYQLCSAKGLCSYDDTHNASRCYCYGKYEGPECRIWNEESTIYESSKAKPAASQFVHTFTETFSNYSLEAKANKTVDVTYDLSQWRLNEGDVYRISDEFNNEDRNFSYFLGIMQQISVPEACNNSKDISAEKAYAFQMNEFSKECYVLGTTASWHLLDNIDDSAHGVTLRYADGGADDGCGGNREFSVSLVCPDDEQLFDAEIAKTITTFVEEVEVCKYSIEIASAFACPYQCLTDVTDENKFSVCSGHGMCVADPYAGYVRCLCDDEWSDAVCQRSPTAAPTSSPTALPTNAPTQKIPVQTEIVIKNEKVKDDHTVFVLSIIGLCFGVAVAIVIGGYCYKKMKNTHEEFKEYTQFKDNTKKKVNKLGGSTGFAIKNSVRVSNVGDASDEEHEDQLL